MKQERNSDFKRENFQEVLNLVQELVVKLEEAKVLAEKCENIEIVIRDCRFKEMEQYINDLSNEFKNHFGVFPKKIYLQAEEANNILRESLI